MNKTLFLAVVLVIAGFGVWKYKASHEVAPSDKPVVKIGVTVPLTGNVAFMGQAIKKGIDIAIAEINRKEGNQFYYKAIFEDDQLKAVHSALNAQRFISIDKVNAIFTVYSMPALAVNSIAEENKVLAIHGAFSVKSYQGKYNFRNFVNSVSLADGVIEFVLSKGFKNAALLFQNTPGSAEVLDKIKDTLESKGIKVESHLYLSGERDFKTVVYKIKESKSDVIVLYVISPEGELIMKELKRQDVEATKIAIDLTNTVPDYSMFEGVYTVDSHIGNAEFIEKFGGYSTYYAPYFYDDVYILYRAFEKVGRDGKIPSSDAIIDEVYRNRNYKGAVGDIYLTDEGSFESKPVLYVVKDGKPVVVE